MASGTKSKNAGGTRRKTAAAKGKGSAAAAARASAAMSKPKSWGTVVIVVGLVVLAVVVFGYAYLQIKDNNEFKITADNQDPSTKIPGVVQVEYPGGSHVKANQRVAYDQSPPFGGPHDEAWASCQGMVYSNPVRSENFVHMLEHGAVWITYNPDRVAGADLDKLKDRVTGQDFMALSPYPGLDRPISLQSWGHQLKVDSADDERIDQFVKSLKRNQYKTPEPNANCNALGPGLFDPDNPPPFDPTPPGPDAVKMDGSGATQQGMTGGQEPPPVPAPGAAQTAPQAPVNDQAPAGTQPVPAQPPAGG